VASHIQCLLEGHTTLEGRPSEVTAEQVEAAYFGLSHDAQAAAGDGSDTLWHGSTPSSRAS
jgi:branched-chain amino acid transport system ATP-binding protein